MTDRERDQDGRFAAGSVGLPRRRARPSLVDLAYEAIVEAIIDRQLKPGSRLGIDALAAELGVSATPIREALARAAAVRLVIQIGNRGFTVAPLLSEPAYHQLFDARYLFEMHAMELADLDRAEARPAIARLAAIAAMMPAMEHGEIYRDFRTFNQADREFHHLLVGLSGNTFLVRAWDDLHFHLHVGRLYTGAGLIDFEDALGEHAALAEALRAADKAAVIHLLSHHIMRAERRLVELVGTATATAAQADGDGWTTVKRGSVIL